MPVAVIRVADFVELIQVCTPGGPSRKRLVAPDGAALKFDRPG